MGNCAREGSASEMFESLRQLVQVNVETINNFRGQQRSRFTGTERQFGFGFAVTDAAASFNSRSVRFWLREDEISVEQSKQFHRQRQAVSFRAYLTLNDAGQCRFRVGTDELDKWQLLRRALEPLFFGQEEWGVSRRSGVGVVVGQPPRRWAVATRTLLRQWLENVSYLQATC